MGKHDIIVIGASAGGVVALQELCRRLPSGLPASLFVVQHISPAAISALPHLLSRSGPLPAFHPSDGEPIRPGHIHVAPPDHHLLVKPGLVLVRRGPKENRTRPAIDPLFRSAAVAYGPRVIGVVLTGMLDDGTAGLLAIKRCGGLAIAQDPDDAQWPAMPRHARDHVALDHCVAMGALPDLLTRLVDEPAEPVVPVPGELVLEARGAERELAGPTGGGGPLIGTPAPISCPECRGTLLEIQDGPLLRFRCQVGHAFSPKTLSTAQAEALEQAFWVALRTHEERLRLFEHMVADAHRRGLQHATVPWEQGARVARENADLLRQALRSLPVGPDYRDPDYKEQSPGE